MTREEGGKRGKRRARERRSSAGSGCCGVRRLSRGTRCNRVHYWKEKEGGGIKLKTRINNYRKGKGKEIKQIKNVRKGETRYIDTVVSGTGY